MSSSNTNLSNLWKKNASIIGKLLAAVLVLLALYWLAKMVWLWIDYAQPRTLEQTNAATPVVNKQQKVDVNQIVNKHLFGIANAKPSEEEKVYGETKLNLKLLGVYVGDSENSSSAIIKADNKEEVYWIGENVNIAGRSNVILRRVEPFQVIISNNGRNETLTLLEKLNKEAIAASEAAKKSATQVSGKVLDKRTDSSLTRELSDVRDKLSSSPQSFADLATFEPVVGSDGQVSGFKIAPGKDPQLFTKLGLRRNDVVTSLNGVELNEQGYWAALDQLQSSETLEINLERNGQPVTLLVTLGDQQSGNNNKNPKAPDEPIEFQ